MTRLKKCTCGSTPTIEWTTEGPYVLCNKCGKLTFWYKTEKEAIRNWNKSNYMWTG